jgi:hypothetical protein
MQRFGWLAPLVVVVAGCASVPEWTEPRPTVPIAFENPVQIPPIDEQVLWETLVEVTHDYFQIEREEPVRRLGGTLTEGRLDTFPEVASTLFEPWRHDSADQYEKLEATLQSIRRRAQIRVVPSAAGFSIDVAVFKELEDVTHPAHAASGTATFRNDATLTRVVSPVGEQEINKGWIPLGRDPVLEQRIIAQLRDRFCLPPSYGPPALMPTRATVPEPIPTPVPALPQAMPPSGASSSVSPGGNRAICRPDAVPRMANNADGRLRNGGVGQVLSPTSQQTDMNVCPRLAMAERRSGPLTSRERRDLPQASDAIDDDALPWFTGYGPDDANLVQYGPPPLDPPTMLPATDAPAFPRLETFQDPGAGFQPMCPQPQGCEAVGPAGPLTCEPAPSGNFFFRNGGRLGSAIKDTGSEIFSEIGGDYCQFYSVRGLVGVGVSLAVAGTLANTSMDRNFQNWHDRQVHTPTLGHFIDVIRPVGNGTYMIPLFILSAVYGSFDPSLPGAPVIGEWGNRTVRSCLVGGPLLLAFQFGLGSSRPELATGTSHWNLFKDSHGASGDAFIGGVALINAAKMTDDVPWKIALYGASILPGYGRVVQDKHYLSQAVLGWALAYLAADAVDRNGFLNHCCGLTPCAMEDGMGVGLMKQW